MREQDILISVSTKPVDPAFYPAGLAQAVHSVTSAREKRRGP